MEHARRTTRRAGPAVIAAACLLVPQTAAAKLPATKNKLIVPGKSIAGVKLDMGKSAVFRQWGKGSCPTASFCEWQPREPAFVGQFDRAVVSFVDGKAVQITIQSAMDRNTNKLKPGPLAEWKTKKDIHIASKLSAVPKAYPGAKRAEGDAVSYNLLMGAGRNVTVTGFGSPGFGPSAKLVSSISVGWSNCHFDPSTTC
jgi:hypothetical protein